METEIIEHQTVTAIVENVDQAKADVTKAFELLIAAKDRLHAVLGHDGYYDDIIPSSMRFSDHDLKDGAKKCSQHITRNAWRYVLAQTGLNHFMTEKRQRELREQIDGDQLPPLTVENVMGTLMGLSGKVSGLLEESIKEVFDWLRPRNNWGTGALKTNQKFRVGPKVIIGYAVERNYGGGFRLNYHRDGNFRALGNVFSLLDGKGVKKYPDDFYSRFNAAMREKQDTYEDEYFECKCYGNGNMHVKFKRLDLVKELNRIGGGEQLPNDRSGDDCT